MDRHCLSMRTHILATLITLTQITASYALPLAEPPCTDGHPAFPLDIERAHGPRIQQPSLAGILPLTASPVFGGPGGLPVVQIGDGQIQAHTTFPPGVYGPPFFPLSGTRSSLSSSLAAAPQGPPSGPPTSPTTLAPLTTTSTTTSTVTQSSTLAVTIVTIPNKSLTSLTTSEVQSATKPLPTNTVGSIQTTLETSASAPLLTAVGTSTSSLSLVNTATISAKPTASISVTSLDAHNIFRPIATEAPPAQIPARGDHPVPRLNIVPQQKKLETNKFYSNFFLGSQSQQTWTFPYAVQWSKGGGLLKSWGLSVSHTERSQVASGPVRQDTGAWSYFTNPIGLQSIILSAAQLGTGTTLTTDSLTGFSANVNLLPPGSQAPLITFPLVQGMGFVSAIYNGATPLISSGVGIKQVTYSGKLAATAGHKYRFALSDGNTWLLYVFPNDATYAAMNFTLLSAGTTIQGPSDFSGLMQVAKIPSNDQGVAEGLYDVAAGVYPTQGTISGSVTGTAGSYSLLWTKQGDISRQLLMYALPHHVQSFSPQTAAQLSSVQLMTTTKGIGTAVLADSWTLTEPALPISMNFAPWSSSLGSVVAVSAEAQALINKAGTAELAQDISRQTYLNSMYYSGKALAKFAGIVYAVHDMANNATLALTGLQQLKAAFAVFVNNQQPIPLAYDSAWGGVVSSASYATGDAGADFGNSYYSDHHFHYGYFIYTAAVIGYLDPTWLTAGTNKAWVNALLRDYANPVDDDAYFPFSRSFDWYHGHSWAKGLFESADGKDQESSSEDTMASYGMKMWGRIIGDVAMEARGNLMLSVQARSLAEYYLYTTDNTVEPAQFIANKAAGILFENKIDHTTYFGTAPEEIEGIHMIPLMPFSTLTRRPAFVAQEWQTYFASYAATVQGGWRGILMANLAIIDPVTSYNFFANTTGTLTLSMLDGGASQTWYLALSAALGGSPAPALLSIRETSYHGWIDTLFKRITAYL